MSLSVVIILLVIVSFVSFFLTYRFMSLKRTKEIKELYDLHIKDMNESRRKVDQVLAKRDEIIYKNINDNIDADYVSWMLSSDPDEVYFANEETNNKKS